MKIAGPFSDLHTEFFEDREPWIPEPYDCDVVVLAGDIVTSPRALTEYISKFREKWGNVPIVYVPGNHEYYGQEFITARTAYLTRNLKDFYPLDRCTVLIKDTLFVGGTLWTDFRKGADFEKARWGLNDFRKIRYLDAQNPNSVGPGTRVFTPEDAYEQHQATLEYFNEKVPRQRTVVVSHHSPSYQSSKGRYNSGLDSCYASSLEYYIQEWKPLLWCHGHIHESNDYTIGTTRVISNPRGYDILSDRSHLNPNFKSDILVEV